MFVDADLAEAAAAARAAARRVEQEYAREQFPVATVARRIDQGEEQRFAQTATARLWCEVNRELANPGIALTRTVLTDPGPADDSAGVVDGDKYRIAFRLFDT